MRKIMMVAIALCIAFSNAALASSGKYLIILQAGTESKDGMARAVHALLYTKELNEKGHEVVLLFDGAGTTWVNQWLDPAEDSKYKKMYEKMRESGVAQVICDYCANAFKVKGSLQEKKQTLTSEYEGHPSIAKYADQGYQFVVL